MATESGSLAAGGMVRGGSIEGRVRPAGAGDGTRGGVIPDGTRRRRKASRDGRIPGDGSGGGIIMGGTMGDLGGGMITGAKAGLAAAGPAGGGGAAAGGVSAGVAASAAPPDDAADGAAEVSMMMGGATGWAPRRAPMRSLLRSTD